MKKFYFLLGVLPILYSCSEFEELPDVRPLSSDVTTGSLVMKNTMY